MTPPSSTSHHCGQQQATGASTRLACSVARWRASIRQASHCSLLPYPIRAAPTLPARHVPNQTRHTCCSTEACSTSKPSQPTSTQFDASPDWRARLAQLAAWQGEHGTCHVPDNAPGAQQLAEWVVATRKAAKRGQLSPEQLRQLDDLGFVWKPNVLDAKWHSNYHLLRHWQHELGHVQLPAAGGPIPSATTLPEAVVRELSVWLARQQELYRLQKLTQLKVALLRKLGVRLRRQSGAGRDNLHPVLQGLDPSSYRRGVKVQVVTALGKQVVAAIAKERAQQQRQRRGTLQQLQQEEDTQLQWQQDWREREEKEEEEPTVTASDRHGRAGERSEHAGTMSMFTTTAGRHSVAAAHHSVAAGHPPDTAGQQPGSHLSHRPLKAAKLHNKRVEFVLMLEKLQRWRAVYGSCHVPLEVFDKPGLGEWVLRMRYRWLRKDPQAWEKEELDASGFVWAPTEEESAWHARYHQLRHWKALHGHLEMAAPGSFPGSCADSSSGSAPDSPSNSTAASAPGAAASTPSISASTPAATATRPSSGPSPPLADARTSSTSPTNSASTTPTISEGRAHEHSSRRSWDGLAEWLEEQRALWASWSLGDPVRVHLLKHIGAIPSTRPSSQKQRQPPDSHMTAEAPVLLGTHPKTGKAVFGPAPPPK